MLNVSVRGIQLAGVVRRFGVPELLAAVEQGEMAVSLAAELARAPADVQREALVLPWREQVALARRLNQQRRGERIAAEQEAERIFREMRGAQDA